MAVDHGERDGRCWGCGYLLRGVESARCPECGREFNRGDRSSMNFGRPMGRAGRWALRPPGGLAVVLAGLGAVLVVVGTGVGIDLDFWRVDRMVFASWGRLRA